MNSWHRFVTWLITAVLSLGLLLLPMVAAAESDPVALSPKVPPPVTMNPSRWEKLERLQQDRQLQDLVEEDLERSIVIRSQIQAEVDRAFGHTTTLINVLLGILTFLPILAAVSIWFIRRSVINQVMGETKQQLRAEVEKQFEQEIAAELKQQAAAFQQEIANLRADFLAQLAQIQHLFSDAQQAKDQIIQELAQITPSPVPDGASPETQQKVHQLRQQLELLKSTHSPLSFTASDYVEQAKALYVEGCAEDALAFYQKALQLEAENARAWLGKGATLAKLQRFDEAIAAYDQVTQWKPDLAEAWFGRGSVLAKLHRLDEAIAAYDRALQIKPDFFLAWFGKARCYALQDNQAACLDALQQAVCLNPDKTRELLKSDAAFDSVRSQIGG